MIYTSNGRTNGGSVYAAIQGYYPELVPNCPTTRSVDGYRLVNCTESPSVPTDGDVTFIDARQVGHDCLYPREVPAVSGRSNEFALILLPDAGMGMCGNKAYTGAVTLRDGSVRVLPNPFYDAKHAICASMGFNLVGAMTANGEGVISLVTPAEHASVQRRYRSVPYEHDT